MKVFCWLLLSCLILSAADDGACYRYRLEESAGMQESGICRFVPSAEQLYNLGGVPEKIRIYDRQGKIVPYMRRAVCLEQSEPSWRTAGTVTDRVRSLPKGALEIYFHLKEKEQPLHEIEIRTVMRDFEQNINLWGRNKDSEGWTAVLENGFIFDSSRNLNARNTVLKLPENCLFSQFRMVVSQANLESRRALYKIRRSEAGGEQAKIEEKAAVVRRPFKIDRILFRTRTFQRMVRQPSLISFPVSAGRITRKEEGHRTVIELRPEFYPLAGLRFRCDDRNFSRTVSIVPDGGPVVRKEIFAVDIPGFRKSEPDLLLQEPGVYPGKITVNVEHGDNPPLENLKLEWLVQEQDYIFLAEKNFFPLTVTAERDGVHPKYEQENVIQAALASREPTDLELSGGAGAVSSLAVRPEKLAAKQNGGWLPWLALSVAVGIMALGIVTAGQKAGADPQEK